MRQNIKAQKMRKTQAPKGKAVEKSEPKVIKYSVTKI